jgi:hypothetical protein
VLNAIKNENRKVVAQGVIDTMIARVEKQLERIPLPSGHKDRDFNFERMVNENVLAQGAALTVAGDGGEFDS